MHAGPEEDRFRAVFRNRHVVLPVIHVASEEQALRNTAIASEAGADGVFLINHAIPWDSLLEIHRTVTKRFPDGWVGVNCLDLAPVQVFSHVGPRVSGVWTDNALIEEGQSKQPQAEAVLKARAATGWDGLYFGGVAFKYQRDVTDLTGAATTARPFMDVVTTSGPGTGQAAHVEKIQTMKAALGAFPLAIASGITPGNVSDYLPYADCFLVATGISQNFEQLDVMKLVRLLSVVRAFDPGDV